MVDKPGVLSRISGILGDEGISIMSVIQRERNQNGKGGSLVIMTHNANEKSIQEALEVIDNLDVVCEKTNLIRVEN